MSGKSKPKQKAKPTQVEDQPQAQEAATTEPIEVVPEPQSGSTTTSEPTPEPAPTLEESPTPDELPSFKLEDFSLEALHS